MIGAEFRDLGIRDSIASVAHISVNGIPEVHW